MSITNDLQDFLMAFKLFLLLEKFLMILPRFARKAFFSGLGTIAYNISSRYRNVSLNNLDFIFGDTKSKKEKDEITKYCFKNLVFNVMHLMELRKMSKEDLLKKITVTNLDAVKKVREENRAIIYIAPHYSAWEIGGAGIALVDRPLHDIFKKLKNETYQDWMLSSRGVFGNKFLEKTNVLKPLIRLVKAKENISIVIDSSINEREGVEVNFLGKTTRQTATPAYLARKYNAAIIPVTIRTDDDENYTLMFFDEIKITKTDNEKEDILNATQAQADWLSKLISNEPKFWFWIHRRWKREYPHIYKK
jgi:KDO2-lipid IV(A) lauroyltransferase